MVKSLILLKPAPIFDLKPLEEKQNMNNNLLLYITINGRSHYLGFVELLLNIVLFNFVFFLSLFIPTFLIFLSSKQGHFTENVLTSRKHPYSATE